MINIQEQIDIFKKEITARYPDLKIGSSYDATEDYYYIWHTNSHLQFEDDDFLDFVGNLIKECFYLKSIFNFSFGYDYLEDEKSRLIYDFKPYNNEVLIKFTNQAITQKPYFYHIISNNNSFNWEKIEGIKIAFDTLDSSFCNQIIGQVSLPLEVDESLHEQEEKALAA